MIRSGRPLEMICEHYQNHLGNVRHLVPPGQGYGCEPRPDAEGAGNGRSGEGTGFYRTRHGGEREFSASSGAKTCEIKRGQLADGSGRRRRSARAKAWMIVDAS